MAKAEKAKQNYISNTDLPRKEVELCLKAAKPIFETYDDKSASWDELAGAMNLGPKSNETKYLIWGAQAYGLINKDDDKYSLSETGRKIIAPSDPSDRKEALIKAIRIPTILSRFYADYNGKFLPEGEYFDNVLATRYNIPKDRINDAKAIITNNANYCGILLQHDSGKTTIRIEGSPITTTIQPQEEDIVTDENVEPVTSSELDNTCFYITPIGEDGSDIRKHTDMLLKHLIEPAFSKFNIKVIRSDKIDKSGLITQQIFEHLVLCKICVADLSYGNPNAFYELGIRHMIKKPTIQIIRKGDKIPFDVSQGRTITIDVSDVFTIMDKIESAKNELSEHIKTFITNSKESISDDNPVSVYLPGITISIAHKSK